ncbi:Hydroxydechloroatrazine ethylaminohydrolase [Xylophilus ampelinus]|nr:Hydroxydechloroatrazine ethylaminohydrolase [Xylophilus ampelinus]
MSSRRTLIRGGHVLTIDPSIPDLPVGDVLIQGNVIQAVGPNLQVADAELVDAKGMVVCPGFVDTHRHTWQTQLRTVASDYTLSDYGLNIRLGYSSFYEPQDAFLGNYAGALEALNAGVTTIVDHCHIINSPEHADEALRGLREAGGRAVWCYGLFPNPKHHPFRFDDFDPSWRLDDARRIRKGALASDDGPVYMGLAPAEVEKPAFEAVAEEVRFGREIGAKVISCHVAMGGHSVHVRPSVTTSLGRALLLGPDILLVHGNSLSRHELGMVRDYGAAISATPEIEVQMGMGRPILGAALRAGARIGLGVDIVSNIGGDMFHPMRSALVEERGADNDVLFKNDQIPRRLEFRCRDVVRVATMGGAEAIGLDSKIGSLTPGKKADVICVRRTSFNTMGAWDPEATLVHYATPNDVDSVWVDGRAIKRNGALLGVQQQAIVEQVWASRERLERQYREINIDQLRSTKGYQRENYGN